MFGFVFSNTTYCTSPPYRTIVAPMAGRFPAMQSWVRFFKRGLG
jgi:hypothetical protein